MHAKPIKYNDGKGVHLQPTYRPKHKELKRTFQETGKVNT